VVLKPGDRLGPWLLGEELGHGSNAIVFSATSKEFPTQVALKVLKARKRESEPFKRFAREVTFLEGLGDFAGVLPVLKANLPEKGRQRAWIAMPIARRLDEALTDASLETVVEAVRTVAETLGRLAAEHDLGHRDIKPGNLYQLDGQFLVGDFGLIDIPDVEELTRTGQKLGPANFTAYEMILDPARADSQRADVYSLAKTLWVLATGINFPPSGHQPADSAGYSLRDQRPHARAGELDQLIDAATRLNPSERPTMSQVATDLQQWQQLVQQPSTFDVTDLRSQIRKALASELETDDRRERQRGQALTATRRLQELIRPLDEGLQQISPRMQVVADDELTRNRLKTLDAFGMPEVVYNWTRCSRLPSGPEHIQYVLRMGRGLELTAGGDLIVRTLLDVGLDKVMQTDFVWESDDRSAPVGTIEAERMLEETVEELRGKLEEALAVFANRVSQQAS
jgi:serine/threonine protein kinase